MSLDNYMARIEQAVKSNITPDTRVTAVMEWDITEREGYQERVYFVMWQNDRESGTHRVHIDSEDRSALFIGEYFRAPGDATTSFYNRIGVKD